MLHVRTFLLIAPFSDIPMFYIKYLTMYKVHMHAGAIRKLLYGCVYVRKSSNRYFTARVLTSLTLCYIVDLRINNIFGQGIATLVNVYVDLVVFTCIAGTS